MTKYVNYITELRNQQAFSIKELALATGIDPAVLSKIEGDKRQLPEKQIPVVAKALNISMAQLKKEWYADKIAKLLYGDLELSHEVLVAAEDRIEYLKTKRSKYPPILSNRMIERLREIDRLKMTWSSKKPLNRGQLAKMKEYFTTNYTHDSNRIEGNTLTLRETGLVLNQGITISGKSVTEHLEAINHAEAVDLIYELIQQKEDFNARVLLNIHGLILRGIDRKNAGIYRNMNVRISGSEHIPPQHYQLMSLMESYFMFYQNSKLELHPVILAAEMHERLVSIHPFVDGNGRTARLIMNLILLRYGYTLVSLKGDENSRMTYYDALEKKQIDNDSQAFHSLIAESVKTSLEEHLKWIE